MKASEVLQSATDVIGQRGAIYGSPKINHERIAARLTTLLEFPIIDWAFQFMWFIDLELLVESNIGIAAIAFKFLYWRLINL